MKFKVFFSAFALLFCYSILHAETVTQYHKVRSGETLGSIEKKFGASGQQLKDWNSLTGTRIYPGQKLIVRKSENTSTVSSKKKHSNTAKVHKGHKNIIAGDVYTVKKGDTLSSISRKTGISLAAIKEMNGLSSSRLRKGQKLTLVSKEKEGGEGETLADNETAASPVAQKDQISYEYKKHQVKKGDTLSKISKRYGISKLALKKLNHLKSSRIKPGQILIVKRETVIIPREISPTSIIPATQKAGEVYYQVKLGDTLDSIADKFKITADSLAESNLLTDKRIKIGQILVIPQLAEKQEDAEEETPVSQNETDDFSKFLTLKIVEGAFRFLNTPYRWGGTSENGVDCSGFVKKVYNEAGIDVPRCSRDQFSNGSKISLENAQPGDLVFFKKGKRINHVGIYLGDNKFIHASRSFGKVVVCDLDDEYYKKHFAGVRSFIAENTSTGDNDVYPQF